MAVNQFADHRTPNEIIVAGNINSKYLIEVPTYIPLTRKQKLKGFIKAIWDSFYKWLRRGKVKDLQRKIKRLEVRVEKLENINRRKR